MLKHNVEVIVTQPNIKNKKITVETICKTIGNNK